MSDLNPYDKFVAGQSPVDLLAATPAKLASLLQAIGTDHASTPVAAGKWSPAQILAHLADCEIAFGFRLRQTLAEDNHIMQPFDQDKWAASYRAVSATQALATFTALRGWNLTLIRAALPGSATKPAHHPERGTMTFLTIVETMAGHDVNHITQLQAAS
jgi:hypothetical protein